MIPKRFKKNKSSLRSKRDSSSLQSAFFPLFLGILLFAAVGFLIFTNLQRNKQRLELNSRIEGLQGEIMVLEERKQELSAGISEVSNESYLEKEARERFNLKKPGEEVVVVVPTEEKDEEQEEQKSFWQKILQKLGF
ncbi:septum formation initiator family protein [Patescibacteria group bacterium]